MEINGKISSEEAARLKALPIKLNYRKLDENTGYAPYFREVLKSEIKEALKGLEKPNGKPYDIYDDGLKELYHGQCPDAAICRRRTGPAHDFSAKKY